jgi:hypothetical protein
VQLFIFARGNVYAFEILLPQLLVQRFRFAINLADVFATVGVRIETKIEPSILPSSRN